MILVLSDLWAPFPGGAERLIFNLARDLHGRGENVQVLTGYLAALRLDGPPVTITDFTTDRDIGGARLSGLLGALAPRVILTHHHYAYRFEAELVASGIPLVQVVLNGRRIPRAALAVYISQWTRDTVGGDQPGDLTMTPPAFAADVAAAQHGDAIGFVKPIPHKGVEFFYRLALGMPERRFVVLRGEWQDLEVIHRLPNVTFMEPVLHMAEFYAECRIILVPSRSEDAGTVAQEATLNGLPCLSTNVGGLAETNAGGLLFDLSAPALAWADAIAALDDPLHYDHVVGCQRRALAAADHAGRLDDLAERIGSL